jgi:hypothetical protein
MDDSEILRCDGGGVGGRDPHPTNSQTIFSATISGYEHHYCVVGKRQLVVQHHFLVGEFGNLSRCAKLM